MGSPERHRERHRERHLEHHLERHREHHLERHLDRHLEHHLAEGAWGRGLGPVALGGGAERASGHVGMRTSACVRVSLSTPPHGAGPLLRALDSACLRSAHTQTTRALGARSSV